MDKVGQLRLANARADLVRHKIDNRLGTLDGAAHPLDFRLGFASTQPGQKRRRARQSAGVGSIAQDFVQHQPHAVCQAVRRGVVRAEIETDALRIQPLEH